MPPASASTEDHSRVRTSLKRMPVKARSRVSLLAAAIKLTRLLAFTGMRLSEVRTLEWSSVDAEAGGIRLSDGKTGARLVPIGTQARILLSSESHEGRFVISDGEDAPLSVRKFRTF